jgi:hypothetical protein
MIEVKKLESLKRQSNILLSKVEKCNPINNIKHSFVSHTGLTRSDISEKIDKIRSCCSVVELKAQYTEIENVVEQVMTVVNGNFCKQHAVCPVCADRSQNRRRARFNEPIKEQASLVKEGKRYAYIITFTITDGNSLAERLSHLKESKLAWRKQGQRRKNGFSRGEASKIKAGIGTIEIKRGSDSGLWHVHAHELIFTNEPLDYQIYDSSIKRELHKKYGSSIPKEILSSAAMETAFFQGQDVSVSKLSKEWLKATGGDSISIDVAPLQHVPKNASYKKQRKCASMSFEQSIAYQAKEVIKYMSKPSENSPTDMITIITDTFNKRMVSTYGEFRGVPGNDYEIENTSDNETYVILWDNKEDTYKNPIPGRYQEFQEEEKTTRVKVAQILGQYRRERRKIISESDGIAVAEKLDEIKRAFKEAVNKTWQFYRNKVRRDRDSQGCDNYNAVLALRNLYVHATHEEIYDFAF